MSQAGHFVAFARLLFACLLPSFSQWAAHSFADVVLCASNEGVESGIAVQRVQFGIVAEIGYSSRRQPVDRQIQVRKRFIAVACARCHAAKVVLGAAFDFWRSLFGQSYDDSKPVHDGNPGSAGFRVVYIAGDAGLFRSELKI